MIPAKNARPSNWLIRSRTLAFRASALLAPAFSLMAPTVPAPPPPSPVVGVPVEAEESDGPQIVDTPTPAAPDSPARQAVEDPLNDVLASQPGRVSIAILNTVGDLVYERDVGARYELASVSKVYILAAYLALLEEEDREANHWESQMMMEMIEASDNRSASDLWSELGGVEGIRHFLRSKGLPDIDAPHIPEAWGEMRASPLNVAVLLRELYNGSLLNDTHSAFALELLSKIVEDQAWGVGAVGDTSPTEDAYFKNGWYPEEWGWTINSAGIIRGRPGTYIIVMLTDSQPSKERGINLIETVVNIFRSRIYGRAGEPLPSFTDD